MPRKATIPTTTSTIPTRKIPTILTRILTTTLTTILTRTLTRTDCESESTSRCTEAPGSQVAQDSLTKDPTELIVAFKT